MTAGAPARGGGKPCVFTHGLRASPPALAPVPWPPWRSLCWERSHWLENPTVNAGVGHSYHCSFTEALVSNTHWERERRERERDSHRSCRCQCCLSFSSSSSRPLSSSCLSRAWCHPGNWDRAVRTHNPWPFSPRPKQESGKEQKEMLDVWRLTLYRLTYEIIVWKKNGRVYRNFNEINKIYMFWLLYLRHQAHIVWYS